MTAFYFMSGSKGFEGSRRACYRAGATNRSTSQSFAAARGDRSRTRLGRGADRRSGPSRSAEARNPCPVILMVQYADSQVKRRGVEGIRREIAPTNRRKRRLCAASDFPRPRGACVKAARSCGRQAPSGRIPPGSPYFAGPHQQGGKISVPTAGFCRSRKAKALLDPAEPATSSRGRSAGRQEAAGPGSPPNPAKQHHG